MKMQLLNLENIGSISIRCKAGMGSHIREAVREALILSLVNECEVDLVHNERVFTIKPTSTITGIIDQVNKS
jgi:hypothetical protein